MSLPTIPSNTPFPDLNFTTLLSSLQGSKPNFYEMTERTEKALEAFQPPKREITWEIIQEMEKMKMVYNEVLSFEMQVLRETDEDTKESLMNVFTARYKKLLKTHESLIALMNERLVGAESPLFKK